MDELINNLIIIDKVGMMSLLNWKELENGFLFDGSLVFVCGTSMLLIIAFN